MSVSGIDVSDHQAGPPSETAGAGNGNPVDWSAVAEAGIGFAFIKATQGRSYVAETFARNWEEAQRVGIVRFAYHFFSPQRDPEVQAEYFLAIAQLGPADLPAALDVEVRDGVDPTTLVARVKLWLDAVEHATGRKPILYTFPSFWEMLGNPRGFSEYPLWIAHHGRSSPTIPRGWSDYAFWQYTSTGHVNGITGNVDLDIFNGSSNDLTAFVQQSLLRSTRRTSDNFVYEGDTGPDVEEIQMLLRGRGFDPGTVDGVFGPRTKAAVVAFQRDNNMIVDGIVGPQTLGKLRA